MEKEKWVEMMEERTLNFARSIIKLSVLLGKSQEAYVLRNQLTKSGTSIGANYHEANRARSGADFRHKIKICESEANETIFWLKLIRTEFPACKDAISTILPEAKQLLAIFTSIANKAKNC